MTSFMNSPLFDFLYLSHTHKEKEREHNFPCSDKLSACPMSRWKSRWKWKRLCPVTISLWTSLSMPVKPSHWGSLWKSRVLTAHSTMKTAQCRWEIARGSNHWIHHKRLEGQPASPDKGGYHNSRYAPPMLQVLSLALRHVCPVGCFFNLRLCSFFLSSSPCSQYRLDKVQASAVFRNFNICWRFVYWMNFMFLALSLILMLNQYYRCTVFYLEHSIYIIYNILYVVS